METHLTQFPQPVHNTAESFFSSAKFFEDRKLLLIVKITKNAVSPLCVTMPSEGPGSRMKRRNEPYWISKRIFMLSHLVSKSLSNNTLRNSLYTLECFS